jgi:hypothetical protein
MRMEKLFDEARFKRSYKEQEQSGSQKDIFLIWMLIMFISVIAAHLVLNLTAGSPTGFVTAIQNPEENITILLEAFMAVFIVVLITALIYTGITKKDE